MEKLVADNQDQGSNFEQQFKKLLEKEPAKLSKEAIKSLNLTPFQENNINAIYNSIAIYKLPETLVKYKVAKIVNAIALQTDRKINNLTLLYDHVAMDLQMNFGRLCIDELYYSLYYGIREEYGDIYYFDIATVYKWIRQYISTTRTQLINLVNRIKQKEKATVTQQKNEDAIHREWLASKDEQIKEYLEGKTKYTILDLGNRYFIYLCENKQIKPSFVESCEKNLELIEDIYNKEAKESGLLGNFVAENTDKTKKLILFYHIFLKKGKS